MFEVLREAYKNQRRIERQFSKINPKATVRINRMLKRADRQQGKIDELVLMFPYTMPDNIKRFIMSEANKPIIHRRKYVRHSKV